MVENNVENQPVSTLTPSEIVALKLGLQDRFLQ